MKKIHSVIKTKLGFDDSLSDKEFLKEWKLKSTQVCKPCWELKYCPYGPFVEQSPLLPPLRTEASNRNEFLKNALATNKIGQLRTLGQEEIEALKKRLAIFKKNPRFLLPEIFKEIDMEGLIQYGIDNNLGFFDLFETPLKDFEKYQVPFPLDYTKELTSERVLEQIKKIKLTPELKKRIKQKINKLESTIKTGEEDSIKELDPIRQKLFEKSVSTFDPDNYPEYIPAEVNDLSCNVFGHICPVVFVGESITETSEKRRKGRYISFKTKIRVVRRDNYTCQECRCHLRDDEVEFDHIIPVSKGGSSEEHNIRLTCYGCNRDKMDIVKV